MDRAFLDCGFEVVPGCEIDPGQRELYAQLCGRQPLCHDIADLPTLVRGQHFAGVIGGPPCQAHSCLRAMRAPKFGDLGQAAGDVLAAASWDWFIFENVTRINVPNAVCSYLDAMHFGTPHQSRPRWFTHSPSLRTPARLYEGTVDSLMAYPGVYGRLYGPKRGAVLQGYPDFAKLRAPCHVLQKGIANAVHYGLSRQWAFAAQDFYRRAA